MDAGTGGASGIDMLQHARRAVEADDARCVLLLAGDVLRAADFQALVDEFNVATREHLAPIPHGGPNSLFAMVTRRHMLRHGLSREAYGSVVVTQRSWAAGNPNASYRRPLSMQQYLGAPMVADPLCIYDCPPVVAGANALVVSRGAGVRIRSLRVLHNADLHNGDGLSTGIASLAPALWDEAGVAPGDVDVVSVYDDYPAMALIQLADLGLGEPVELVDALSSRRLPVNTSGGQLSAGQAGAAGGMLGIVEVVRQLRGTAGMRQVEGAALGIVTGYGMIAYRHGVCANAVVLEAP
jgi:acetyl-CoA acetyltransferase